MRASSDENTGLTPVAHPTLTCTRHRAKSCAFTIPSHLHNAGTEVVKFLNLPFTEQETELREIGQLAQDHTAGKWHSRDLDQAFFSEAKPPQV